MVDAGLPAGRGLDLGCGDGLLTRILLRRTGPRNLVGIDNDGDEVEIARNLGLYQALHVGSAAAVREPDASFDFVFSNSVLEHVDDIDGVLTEVARLLRPGGTFVFTVPSRDFQSCLRGSVLPGRDRRLYLARMDRRLYHLRYWAEEDWARLLEPLGLRVEMARPYMSRAYVRRWESISGFTAGVLYLLWHRQARPIEIQRRLGMRRSPRTMPGAIARGLARLLSAGLRPSTANPYGCLLVRAQKTGTQ